ncbi:MAG TPA: hypothetical protein VEX86_11915 [Longimicrobium sp.]|nr:hypothetical protein [Longimicrobium sp.]
MRYPRFLALAPLLALAACGGGGAATTTAPVGGSWSRLVRHCRP